MHLVMPPLWVALDASLPHLLNMIGLSFYGAVWSLVRSIVRAVWSEGPSHRYLAGWFCEGFHLNKSYTSLLE